MKTFRRIASVCAFVLVFSVAGRAADPIYENPGKELTDFLVAFGKAMGPHEEALTADKKGMLQPVLATAIVLALLGNFDKLGGGEGDTREGNVDFMLLRDVSATRIKSGDKITFTGRKVHDRDFGDSKEGDVWMQTGALDVAANTLTTTTTIARGDEMYNKTTAEMVRLSDGTWLLQSLSATDSGLYPEPKIQGVFIRFNDDEFSIATTFNNSPVNFEFKSLLGQGDTTVEAMAEGYTIRESGHIKDGAVIKAF